MNAGGTLKSPIGPDWKPAIRLGVFFSWGDGVFSRCISRLTGGPSHMGIVFQLQESGVRDQESDVYYENLFAKGFRGPKDLEDLRGWARSSEKRRCEIYWLRSPRALAELKHVIAHTWVGLVGYAEWKIASFLLLETIGKKIGFRMRSDWNRWVCSTSAATILAEELDLRIDGRSLLETTPQSARDAVLKKELWEVRECLGGRPWQVAGSTGSPQEGDGR